MLTSIWEGVDEFSRRCVLSWEHGVDFFCFNCPEGNHKTAVSWSHPTGSSTIDYSTISAQDLLIIVTASHPG